MSVYFESSVKLNLMTFHRGAIMQTPRSASTWSAIQLLVDTYLKDIHTQNVR